MGTCLMTSYHPSFDGRLKPNLSFPPMEQTTPLCRLRIKYYAHGCPRSVDSSIVCDQDVLSVTFSSFSYISSMCCTSYLGLLMLQGLVGHSTISSRECLTPILVNSPFVALGKTVHFPHWEQFFEISFMSHGRFRKKNGRRIKKSSPSPL